MINLGHAAGSWFCGEFQVTAGGSTRNVALAIRDVAGNALASESFTFTTRAKRGKGQPARRSFAKR